MKRAGSSYDELVALRTKTVHERAKLAAASGDRSRLDMTAAHVLSLLERFPVLYREAWATPSNAASPFARDGFDVSDGWFGIVERMSAKLAADPANHIDQLKEKWGRLTVYLTRPEDAAAPAPTAAGMPGEELDRAIDEAEEESERTCLVCGEPGTSEKRGRWVTVLCGPCVQLFNMADACRRIADRTKDLDFTTFSASENVQDAVRLALVHIGHATAGQPPKSRERLPSIGWERLERLKKTQAVMGMSVDELWRFASEEAPGLERKLR
ncbi:MAG: hypothetical protein WBP56_13465 [Polyangia bacterium]